MPTQWLTGNKTTRSGIEQLGLSLRAGQDFLEAYDWMEKSDSMNKIRIALGMEEGEKWEMNTSSAIERRYHTWLFLSRD